MMRIAQLASKISRTTDEIVVFLRQQGHEIEKAQNLKLTKEQIDQVLGHLAPDEMEEAEPETEEKIAVPAYVFKEPEFDLPTCDYALMYEDMGQITHTVSSDLDSSDTPEDDEVIKPQLVKLEGLKVVGKIEVEERVSPEERKRQKEEERRKKEEEKKQARIESELKRIARKKEKEAKIARQKQQERNKRAKEIRRQRYLEQLKESENAQPSKAKPTKKSEEPNPKKAIKKHSNPIIRFWEWLNGKYDEF